MSEKNNSGRLFADEEEAKALDTGFRLDADEITEAERQAVVRAGKDLTKQAQEAGIEGVWLLINGEFTWGDGESTESQIRKMLYSAFEYPRPQVTVEDAQTSSPGSQDVDSPERTLNVLLDSPGGNLDGAYTTALYLSAYASRINVHVPGRAKSASTLLALGAHQVYMSPFGELGPLDTQIPDPRNPANTVSALDCYQSVDYVRKFGFATFSSVLPEIVKWTERRIPISDLINTASEFSLGSIRSILEGVKALDFGGWGRSLRIGEQYARKLLEAKAREAMVRESASGAEVETGAGTAGEKVDPQRIDRIASQLVYGYTHHPFPIDYYEAGRLGFNVKQMKKEVYEEALNVLASCKGKNFVGFISGAEAEKEAEARRTDRPTSAGRDSSAPREPVLAEDGRTQQMSPGRARRGERDWRAEDGQV